MSENYTFDEYLKLINNALAENLYSVSDGQDIVLDAMKYSLEGGGKRIRPVLVLEFCKVCDGNVNDALNFACAIEMIHTYSLIHDDLPCMDNDDMRRGKLSCHKAFGEEYALLAGDALLTQAFEIALKNNNNVIDKNKILAVKQLASLSGINGMIGGQVLDLLSENEKPEIARLQTIDKLKTGALIKAAVLLGCYAANVNDENIFAAAVEYASDIGLAFQIVDDILDVTSDAATLGKPIGSDEKNDKMTYVSLLGIDKSKEIVLSLTNEAINALSVFENDTTFLKNLAKNLANRNK